MPAGDKARLRAAQRVPIGPGHTAPTQDVYPEGGSELPTASVTLLTSQSFLSTAHVASAFEIHHWLSKQSRLPFHLLKPPFV